MTRGRRPDWWGAEGTVAVAHDVRSMHNVGAIFRTADAAGFAGVLLSGISGAPPDQRIAKVALGAEETLPFVRVATLDDLIATLDDVYVVLLEQHPQALPVNSLDLPAGVPVALVVCGEIDGAPDELVGRADVVAEIPMFGRKESLNVSVAFGVAAYAVALARRDPVAGMLAVRGKRPVREGVLTRGITRGEVPSAAGDGRS